MRENEIRPQNLMNKGESAKKADIKRMQSKKSEFVKVACPACGSNKRQHKYTKWGFNFDECLVCQTFYTNPRPTPKILEWFYAYSPNYDYWNKYIFPASEQSRRKQLFVPRVDRLLEVCRKYKVKTGSLLEVGAAHGIFCEELKSRKVFKRVVAVEPSKSLAETCRNKGIEVVNLPIEKYKGRGFDVVVHFETMEHLFSPKNFLTACHKALNKDGLLAFTVPNGMGFDVVVQGTASHTIDHEHLNYLNPFSVEVLLKRCGFIPVDISTPGKLDVELVKKSGKAKGFIKQLLTQDFQEFISTHKLSGHMLVVAKKMEK